MKIAVACDPAGVVLKEAVMETLKELGAEATYFGIHDEDTTRDYPVFALRAAKAVANGEFDRGIVICGTGVGISMAANKVKGVRAALCTDCFMAQATREHNNANVLALGGRVVGVGLALKIVDTFLNTEFSNDERHIRRIEQIEG